MDRAAMDRAGLPAPDALLDGGDLDCGGGLLLLIRRHLDPLDRGQILEIRSTEISVDEDLPAWCRLTSNELVDARREGAVRSFLVCKGSRAEAAARGVAASSVAPPASVASRPPAIAVTPPKPPTAAPIGPPLEVAPLRELAVMGIGSWPRPAWMLRALHERLSGRASEAELDATADDAVRLVVAAQERAGADVISDGEQRRDSYASFVGNRLDNCQLVPLTDLLPLVDDPEHFRDELAALDVPASEVRHPAVLGRITRSRPIAAHELAFVRTLTERPVKVALPGPYLLARTMWLECLTDRFYATREEMAADLVVALRDEARELLAGGATLVQFDEPVLSEVVFGAAHQSRTFMCGALSERGEPAHELDFARELLDAVTAGLPRDRLAVHVCRGNWSPDERVALRGDYGPLLGYLSSVRVGTCFLEMCTERAGDIALLAALPADRRIGVGVVNQKDPRVESVDEVAARMRRAIDVLGASRVLFNPDCGFATFADNPVTASAVAEQKLATIVRAAAAVRAGTSASMID